MVRLVVFALSPILWATDVGADRYSDCNQFADPVRSIRGCTAIIDRGKRESQKNRAVAYWSRGNTYYLKRELDEAIAEAEEVMRLEPDHPDLPKILEVLYQQRGQRRN